MTIISDDPNILWRPQAKQAAFLARFEDEALYGGAAGGGKSEALVVEALRQVHIPGYRGLIVRRTYPQLEDLVGKSRRLYGRAFPGAVFSESRHLWTFPSGATVQFGSMPHEQDKFNYQGRPYDFIGIDELTQFTFSMYDYLVHSRNRPNVPGTRVYARFTANPGGVGHAWVKERFITAAPPLTTHWRRLELTKPDGETETRWASSVFVPASVFDNEALLKNDPGYLTRLAAMPEAEKKALLYGDWESFSGQVFAEWRDLPEHYADRLGTHVIEPFPIPADWGLICGLDWGYSRPFSVGWYAVDHEGRLYRVRELYGCAGSPNVGVKWEPGELARAIRRVEEEDPNLRGRRIRRVGDPAIWGSDGTESIGAILERERLYFERGRHERLMGKMQVHHRLAFDERGLPGLCVFRTCRHFIRTLPALVYSETDVEDVDTTGEDHAYDELRYVCMERPVAPPRRTAPARPAWDPLS